MREVYSTPLKNSRCSACEDFAGQDREEEGFPVQYLGANIPQAWAAGSIFMLLRAILGIEPNAHKNLLHLNPTLPDWLPDLTITGLRVGNQQLAILLHRGRRRLSL